MTSTLFISPATSETTIEIRDSGHLLARAEVGPPDSAGVVHSALSVSGGHLAAETRACLVDAVLDTPTVRTAGRVLATLPISDVDLLVRMRQRCDVLQVRAAGATKLVEARLEGSRVPSQRRPG
jgi:hypothetical protein